MQKRIECSTQAGLEECVRAGNIAIVHAGFFVARESAHVVAWGSAHVKAWGSAHVVARGSAHVVALGSAHVEALGSAHVEAWGSAHVVARESAHVEAWGSAHVEAWGSAHVEAWGHVFVRWIGATVTIKASAQVIIARMDGAGGERSGGHLVRRRNPRTAAAWCEYWGVKVTRGVAMLYKGVDDSFRSDYGGNYAPGAKPEALDWDGGRAECGGGLHFSPTPAMTRVFCSPRKFLACPVALSDMRAPKAGDNFLMKIKARGCAGPIRECDEDGNLI